MSYIADRMKNIDSSGIRKVFDLGAKLKDPINLSIGQPDFDVFDPIKDAAISAINEGMNRYTLTAGIPELKEKILKYYETFFGRRFEDILISSGVSGGLFLAFLALINPGDEVLFLDPYFVMYKHLTNLLGGVCKYVNSYPDFRLKADEIERQISPKSKILIVNSPNNPTGALYTEKELKEAAMVAKKHNLLLISDEIYKDFYYTNSYHSMASLYDNLMLLGGFSKSYAMTGWRVGYALGPKEIIAKMVTLQQYTFVCAPSFAQKAALVAMDQPLEEKRNDYRNKRDAICLGLDKNFELEIPDGAFYAFPKAPHGTGESFVGKAIENNVLIIPGNVFSERNTHFRISFATSIEKLKQGQMILNKLASS